MAQGLRPSNEIPEVELIERVKWKQLRAMFSTLIANQQTERQWAVVSGRNMNCDDEP